MPKYLQIMCAKYYELRSQVRCMFYLKKLYSLKLARLLDTASKFALFSVSGLKDKKLIKSKPTQKLKHANSILESFEYFCQISSKSIVIILSYTVSKLTRFFRHSVDKLISNSPLIYRVTFSVSTVYCISVVTARIRLLKYALFNK